MPVTYVYIEWPDQQKDQVYSPSSVVENYFNPEQEIPIAEFSNTCNKSLNEASHRVAQKFGFGCTSAMAELKRIQSLCQKYSDTETVKILSIK